MATKRQKVIVEIKESQSPLNVWCDEIERWKPEILSIEGVDSVFLFKNYAQVWLDPRYDKGELRAELLELLTAEVPNAFLES